MRSALLETIFPNLRNTKYEIESPKTPKYNCIAWAAGVTNRPWWPINCNPYYWPIEPRVESLEAFINAFKALGYKTCNDRNHEIEFEKVAIYVDSEQIPTHMARQISSKDWSSKCGDLQDITHTLEGLEGLKYGKIAQIMKRRI